MQSKLRLIINRPPMLPGRGLTKLSDAQLVQEYRNGNSPAFEALVKRYSTELSKYIGKIAGRSLAGDALQETWVAVITALLNGSYKEDQHFERWLKRIARRKAVDAWRSEHRFNREELMPDTPDESLNEEELFMNMESEGNLMRAFRRLNSREKRVVLYYLWGKSFTEIAKRMNIKNSAIVRMTHYRALKKIAAFIL